MADDGYDPLPTYEGGDGRWEMGDSVNLDTFAPQSPISDLRSLSCISPPAHSFLNTSFGVVERLRQREKEPILQMHPLDARARQIGDGDAVRVWNTLGAVTLRARITTDLIPGTVLAPGVWWTSHSRDGRNINQIVGQDEADMGAGACFYGARAFVAPASHPATTDMPAPELAALLAG